MNNKEVVEVLEWHKLVIKLRTNLEQWTTANDSSWGNSSKI